MKMNHKHPPVEKDLVEFATKHFDLLNGLCEQERFVAEQSRQTHIDEYVTYIWERGARRFEEYATRSEKAMNEYTNNQSFLGYLRKALSTAMKSRGELLLRLKSLNWIPTGKPSQCLLENAGRCESHEWVGAKAAFIDGLDLSPAEKVKRFEREIDAAIQKQNIPRNP